MWGQLPSAVRGAQLRYSLNPETPSSVQSTQRESASSPFPAALPSCPQSRNGSCPPSKPFQEPSAAPEPLSPSRREPSPRPVPAPPLRPDPAPPTTQHRQYRFPAAAF